jgi:hypothetical protein
VVENLTGLFSDQTCDWMFESKEMTTGKVRKLAATARTSEDHLVIARFYRAQATSLDEDAAGYELAASNLRNGPEVKNFVAPATGARLEFAAKRFREEAKTERALAASHENMAKAALRR